MATIPKHFGEPGFPTFTYRAYLHTDFLIDDVNYRFMIYFLAAPILTLYCIAPILNHYDVITDWNGALCLTGCVSNSIGIPTIFAATLRDRSAVSIISEIRVNYFDNLSKIPKYIGKLTFGQVYAPQ